jgi:UDP-glucose:(heptosyl)LPS alpha-1,3-glucosyltransferase
MKIALIRRRYTSFGGAERYVAELARTLTTRGHDTHIYAERWRNMDGLTFHRVPTLRGMSFVEILSFAHGARKLIQKSDYDIVHSFERTFCQDVYRAGDGCHREWLQQRRIADNFFKCRTYAINPMHRAILQVERKLYQDPRLKVVIVNSHRVKQEIIFHYGFPEERIRVIHNGLNPSLLDPGRNRELPPGLRLEKGERMILFLGSGFERKNLATAIRALALIDDPAVRLWVVGKDRLAPYRRLARDLGVERRVVFAGPQDDPVPFYAKAAAFVLPTIYEPFSNACLEASAFGLPVVTSRMNGFSELIRSGENGYIIEYVMDPAEVAEKIQGALSLSKLPYQNYPTIHDNVDEMLGLYEAIINKTLP